MSTTLLCFKAIFLFELCNEAWTFEVAKMSSEKKVITQFILWLSYFCKQAKTFVKTLRGRRSWARNFSSTKCSPKCINSIKGCYTENLLRGYYWEKLALVLSRLPTAIYPRKEGSQLHTQDFSSSCGHKLCLFLKEKSWARANRKITKWSILISNFDLRHLR